MRHIAKGEEPPEFSAWKERLGEEGYEYDWNSLRPPEKDILRRSLLKEQGFICCYCEQRLEADHTTLIEHLRPRSKDLALMFDYANLTAECRGGPSSRPALTHCGQAKGNWYDELLFVSPLNPDCGNYFLFTDDGHILATEDPARRKAAETTIKKLNLNVRYLVARRNSALKALGELNQYTDAEIGTMIVQFGERDRRGRLEPFCSAIISVLRWHQRRSRQI